MKTKAKPNIKLAPRKISRGFVLNNGKFIKYDPAMHQKTPAQGAKDQKAGKTQELQPQTRMGRQDLVEPPLDPGQLAGLLRSSTPHYRAIKAKSGDSVKRGWTIEEDDGPVGTDSDRLKLIEFFRLLSSTGQTFKQTLEAYVIDLEAIGYAAIELVKEKDGTPTQLNHIRAKTLRRTRDFKRFEHSILNKSTFFKMAGLEDSVEAETGEIKEVDFDAQANELMWVAKYDPNSDYYGMPDITPALKAVAGDLFQKEFNLDFFENGAVPAYMVIIEGAELDETLEEMIEDFFTHELKGTGNTHRTMILPIPIEGVTVKIEKVAPVVNEGSFRLYHEQNNDEILQADGVPATRAFIQKKTSFGRDQSRELNKNYKEAEIAPLQELVEDQINTHVIRLGFKIKGWIFKLNPLFFEDRELLAQAAERVKKTESVSVNEMRRLMSPAFPGGLEPVDGGDEILLMVGGIPTPLSTISGVTKAKGAHVCDGWKRLADPELDLEDDELTEWDGASNEKVLEVVNVLRPIVKRFQQQFSRAFAEARRQLINNLEGKAKEVYGQAGVIEKIRMNVKQPPLPISIVNILRNFDDTEAEIKTITIALAGAAYQSGFELAERRVGISLDFNLARPQVQAFLDNTVTPFSENIGRNLSNRIRRTLAKGIMQGEPLAKLTGRISKVFDGVERSKALQIARTESARAHNVGTIDGYEQSKVVRAVSVDDGEDFDIPCSQANGATWTLAEAKKNPIEHPNCVRSFSPIVMRPGEPTE